MTATKSRQKHQQQMIHSALMTEQISKRVARENFALSTVAVVQAASFEALLHQSKEEEDERQFTNSVFRLSIGFLRAFFSVHRR